MEDKVIASSKVSETARDNFLFEKVGKGFIFFEAAAFSFADKFCSDYKGGYWEFYELDNGAFFIAPEMDKESIRVSNEMNYAEVDCSPEALGIIVSVMGLTYAWEKTREDHLIDLIDGLKDYAYNHKDASAIIRVLD